MKIEIEIPKEFEEHFKQDRFEDTLHRLSSDAHSIAGHYEQETAAMLIKAFKEGKTKSETAAAKNPLTFRLYQSIRFNRPVDKETDIVSPGGYELKMRDEAGVERTIRFDFEDFEGSVSKTDPCVVECMQKNPDCDSFPDLVTVTEFMLRNVTEVVEWFVYTGEPANEGDPLVPVEVTGAYFGLVGKDYEQIPIRASIGLSTTAFEYTCTDNEVKCMERGEKA